MARIVGDSYDEAKREAVEAVQWEISAQALSLWVDVILKNGFWAREERDDLREWAAASGADSRLNFLDVPKEELLKRLKSRNAVLPLDTFSITEAQLDTWWNWFEPPTQDEL